MIASKKSLLGIFQQMNANLALIPQDNEKWVEAFNSLGIEVEEIISNHLNPKDYCVVEIKEVKDHEDSDHLHVCQVWDGQNQHQIICGAQNVYVGMYTIMAKVNTVMPNGMEIKSREIRGVTSNGMLCSVSELFPAIKNYLTDTDTQGIVDLSKQGSSDIHFELKPQAENWIDYLMLDDDIFDLSITTNSGYMNGLLPVAISLLAYWDVIYDLGTLSIVQQNISNTHELVKEIGVIKFDKINTHGTYKLRSTLAHNFLSAQTLAEQNALWYSHYFSFPIIAVNKDLNVKSMQVSKLEEDTDITTANNDKYMIPKDTIVVKQDNSIICLPGLFTTNTFAPKLQDDGFYLLYSSTDWAKVTKLAMKLNVSTYNLKLGGKLTSFYFLNNYLKYFFASVRNTVTYVANHEIVAEGFIKCSRKELFDKLTSNQSYIDQNKILRQLDLLGLYYDKEREGFIIPPYRTDLENSNDLIEEALKFINVNKLVPEPILSYMESLQNTKAFDLINDVRRYLINLGLYEVKTYELISENQLNNDKNPVLDDVKTQVITNPISKEREVVKHNDLSSLFEVMQYNLNQKNYEMHNIFEVAKLYWQSNENANNILSAMFLVDLVFSDRFHAQTDLNFNLIFDLIKNIANVVLEENVAVEFKEVETEHPNYLKLYAVNFNNTKLGFVGVLAKTFENNFIGNNMPVYYFEINLDTLIDAKSEHQKYNYQPISKFPAISRDLNIEIDPNKDYADLFIDLQEKLHDSVEDFSSLSIKDVFVTNDKKVITLNYIVHPKSTLSKDEINKIDENIKQIINTEIH